MRNARRLLGVTLAAGLAAGAGSDSSDVPVAPDLVVHEWGTFTTIAGPEGRPVGWDPFAAASELPSFVRVGMPKTKAGAAFTVRMETPVLYFYANAPLVVSAEVAFPGGAITEWYPDARLAGGGRIGWDRVEVWPGARAQLPVEPRPSHYYPARATDAALLRSSAGGRQQYERFLFYRGVGNVTLPATAQRRDERVLVRSTSGLALGAAILLEKREGVLAWHVAALDEEVEALALPAPGRGQPELEATLVGALVAQGLYEKEALAMVACWSDTWFGDGLRLIYFLPRVVTDRLLPLTLVPRPARLERVMVGRIELSRG